MMNLIAPHLPLLDLIFIGTGYALSQAIVFRADTFSVATSGFAALGALMLGLRYEVYNNLFCTLRADGLAHNFVSRRASIRIPKFISGAALTVGYNTPIGPLELSATYSPDTGNVGTYINLGLAF